MCAGDRVSRVTYTDTVAGEKNEKSYRRVKQSEKRAVFLVLARVYGVQVTL